MKNFLGTVSGKINTHSFSFVAKEKVKKFQYIKLYHEETGFILAQVVELINEDNKVLCECEIIGYRDSRGLLRVPNTTVSSDSEVYNADSEFIKKVLGLNVSEGLYLGLLEEYNMIRVFLNAKKLVTKHLAVLAKTGAGKSYTLGVIVEELAEKGVPCLIIDPHGEYSSLKHVNTNRKELDLMHRYDVKPKNYAEKIVEYTPNTLVNPNAKNFSISINSLTAQEIANLTPMKVGGTQLGILYNAINEVKKENSKDYDLDDIRANLESVNSSAKYGLLAALDFLDNVGVFTTNPVNVEELVTPGKITLLNLKGVTPDIQQIIVAKICTDLFEKRKKNKIPPLFLIIEEAHNFCPERSFGESPSSYILRNIASEGRKFGLGLGVVSQRPARVDKNVLSQCNTQIIQKVTNPNDLRAISNSAENISASIVDDISTLPIGTALLVGASAKPILVDVRVKRTEHGGKSVSFDYKKSVTKKQPSEAKKNIKIKIVNAPGVKELTPCYLARVKEEEKEFNLLLDESGEVLTVKNGSLTRAVLNKETQNLQGKAGTILNIVKKEGETSISKLFNSLNYSFQDINFILRDLQKKGLLIINGSIIKLKKEELKFIQFAWDKGYTEIGFEKNLPGHRKDFKSVKNLLESNGLIVESLFNVYVK